MKRAEKIESVQELSGDLGRATVAVLAEYRGLTAGQMNRLRRAIREADGRCRVAKNTLAKRAVSASSSRYERLGPLFQGPLALLIGFRDPVAMAKVVVKLAEELPKLEIKGAVLDGRGPAREGAGVRARSVGRGADGDRGRGRRGGARCCRRAGEGGVHRRPDGRR